MLLLFLDSRLRHVKWEMDKEARMMGKCQLGEGMDASELMGCEFDINRS